MSLRDKEDTQSTRRSSECVNSKEQQQGELRVCDGVMGVRAGAG